MSTQYRVYVTPLLSSGVYGSEIEISDRVQASSGTVTKSIDSTDFSVGIYTFNDVSLSCDNSDGYLSDSSDSRSIFKYSRDLAKVRIVYYDGVASVAYRGVINDEASTIDSDEDLLTMMVLGPDSVLKKSIIPAGTVTNGMTIQQALVAILNTSDIKALLGVSLDNLNPVNNVGIDDGTKFDNLNKRDAVAQLIAASNSVVMIDDSWNIIVRSRYENSSNSIVYLYGKGSTDHSDNILSISNYNTGLQRVFNAVTAKGGTPTVTVTDTNGHTQSVSQPEAVGSYQDTTSQAIYGVRQKSFTFDWITTASVLQSIANSYVNEFSYAKIELEVTVPTDVVTSAELLDMVSVNYPLQTSIPDGKRYPIIGVTKIGDTDCPLPYVKGAITIDSSLGFKIIERTDDIESFTSTLKLRQLGTVQTDGGLLMPISVVSKTTGYTMTTSDDVVLGNAAGGAFTVTLPDPAAYPKKEYTIKKTDASFNAVNVTSPSGGFPDLSGTPATFSLVTQNDTIVIFSDGTNWYVKDHRCNTDWVSYTPTGGWSTNSTYSGRWRRIGDSIELNLAVALSGAPNTATLYFNLPSGLTIDNSKYPNSGDSLLPGTVEIKSAGTISSSPIVDVSAGPRPLTSTGSIINATTPGTFTNGDYVNMTTVAPITGWHA